MNPIFSSTKTTPLPEYWIKQKFISIQKILVFLSRSSLFYVIIFNLWIWNLATSFPLYALIAFLATVLLFLILHSKGKSLTFTLLFFTLLYAQFNSTTITSLTGMSNDQINIRDTRLKEYPPVYIKIGNKTIWIPLANWFEIRKESVAVMRIQKNLSEVIGPNMYFFANHPRERVGYKEIEMLPYVFLPFLVLGIVRSFKLKYRRYLYFSLLTPLLLTSIIGVDNPLGPFSLIPFFNVTISQGLDYVFKKIYFSNRCFGILITLIFIVITFLIFIQMIAYAKN